MTTRILANSSTVTQDLSVPATMRLNVPVATNSSVGVVKPGTNLSVAADGTLSATGGGSSLFVNVLDYGAVADGVTDNTAAFAAAITAATSSGAAGTVFVPKATNTYYFASDLEIHNAMSLLGDGIIRQNGAALQFAHAKGVRIYQNAQWTRVSNIRLTSVDNGTTSGVSGIRVSAHGIFIENVGIDGFGNCGVELGNNVNADAGNANDWYIANCRFEYNFSHGFFCSGPDSNAGVATQMSCALNGGFGVYDDSFLGNTYISCHTADNTLGAYKTTNHNGATMLLNCYSESGQPASDLVYPTIVLGGLQAAGFTAASTNSFMSNQLGAATLTALDVNVQLSGQTYTVGVNENAANGDILTIYRTDVSAQPWRLKWENGTSGDLRFGFGNASSDIVYEITGVNTTQTFGRSAPVPWATYIYNLFLGNRGRQITYADSVPTTGAWATGDIVFSNTPSAGGLIGWVCTSGGSPGIWNTFGPIVPTANFLAADTTANLTAGYTDTSYNLGTITSGTTTLDATLRNIQHCVNGGVFTLAPQTAASTIQLDITNNASAGAISTVGFTKVSGSFDTTNGHSFRCYSSVGNAGSLLVIQALF